MGVDDRPVVWRNGVQGHEIEIEKPKTVEITLPSEDEVLKARYGDIDRQLVIPRPEPGSVDRPYVSNMGLFLRNKVVEESAPTGRANFVKFMRHY